MNTTTVLVDVAVKDLSGPALDWAVARALGYVDYPDDSVEQGGWWYTDPVKAPFCERLRKSDWNPSTGWRQGGPVLDAVIDTGAWSIEPSLGACTLFNYDVADYTPLDNDWRREFVRVTAPTLLAAACLALVAIKLGDIVKVPACLVLP